MIVTLIILIILNIITFFETCGYKAMWRETSRRWAKTQEELEKENKRLRKAIEVALRISDLWILKEVEPEHESEATALLLMKEEFEQALKGGG